MRLKKLKIKNFRGIGIGAEGDGVEVEFDSNNIIFICGENNAGKSTILEAYDMLVTANRKAKLNDFHEKNMSKPIEIEAWVQAETDSDREHKALAKLWDADGVAKVRKKWLSEDAVGAKETKDPLKGWNTGGAGGMDTLLQNACPTPVWIRGSTAPEEILALLQSLVQETILKALSSKPVYLNAIEAVEKLEKEITESKYSKQIQKNLNLALSEVFPSLKFLLGSEGNTNIYELFKKSTVVSIEQDGKPAMDFMTHGHGVRRQFIVSALRGLAKQLEEIKKTAKQRKAHNFEFDTEISNDQSKREVKSRILLIEEPELYLHPEAIRCIRDLIYELGNDSEFQILAATHAPIMVDLSKPHTTLVRACVNENKVNELHQVSHDLFTPDERDCMKMLNYFNPHVCEAFFNDKVVLVEGDTEAVAIRAIMTRMISAGLADESVHVVNCGTKNNIPFFQRVLTHFKISHWVLHDVDSRTDKNGDKNSAWTLNEKIWEAIEYSKSKNVNATRFTFESEFETGNGYKYRSSLGKPYSAFLECQEWELDDLTKQSIKYLRFILGIDSIDDELHSQDYLETLVEMR
ncbi:ATP-dependent nuclease [Vibrio coralliilyticus]|uniref:ATP-dependent endonuclease n=1 Tax=Vibrio coralliilyticus TaxID=190893 RepID=A0AAP7DDE5_9VIBR|nr:ATP-dependent endonuclease [Vibrio coralliilyticus]